MIYEFIIDSTREDSNLVCEDLRKKTDSMHLSASSRFYFAKNKADAERHVRMTVFLLPKEEICFVACGDFTGQVAAGLVGAQPNKSMAILDYNLTDDLLKSFPGRDFKDFKKMLDGEVFESDMIKLNDDYCLNICGAGLSAGMMIVSHEHSDVGLADDRASKKAIIGGIFNSRRTRGHITADGRALNGNYFMNVHIANGQWSGSKYHNSPDAVMDDGLLDVGVLSCVPLAEIPKSFKLYETGDYNSTAYGRKHSVICRAKHIEIESEHLIYMSYDGEITAATNFEIDVVPKAVKIILPKI